MVPAGGPTHDTITALGELLDEGDVVIDGGNSRWTDDQTHAELLGARRASASSTAVSPAASGASTTATR